MDNLKLKLIGIAQRFKRLLAGQQVIAIKIGSIVQHIWVFDHRIIVRALRRHIFVPLVSVDRLDGFTKNIILIILPEALYDEQIIENGLQNRMQTKSDIEIIAHLEANARQSFTALSEAVGMSKTPCWSRVKALENDGAIMGYSARVDPKKLGLNLRALVRIVVDFDQHEAFEAAVIAHSSIYQCHSITGDFDYLLDVLARDIDSLDLLLRQDLSRLPGVQRFSSTISTRLVKAAQGYSGALEA